MDIIKDYNQCKRKSKEITNLDPLTSLERLIFGYNYNQVKLVNLKFLLFGTKYNKKTDFSYLINLEELYVGKCYNQKTVLTGLYKLQQVVEEKT